MKILFDIKKERASQIEKFGDQNRSLPEWVSILTEETGEVAQVANDYHFRFGMHRKNLEEQRQTQAERLINLRKELIQVAAVAVAIIQDIDKNYPIDLDPTEEYWSQQGAPFDEDLYQFGNKNP